MADHRSALVAALGLGAVGSLLPCHHRQGQPEVSRSAQLGLCSSRGSVLKKQFVILYCLD